MRIRRISPTGLEFLVDTVCNDKNRVKVTLERSQDKSVDVKLSLDEFSQCWFNWQMRNQNIQLAFPTVPACVREFFMTAITPAEWDRIFAGTDDEEATKQETSSEAYERYLKEFPFSDPRD